MIHRHRRLPAAVGDGRGCQVRPMGLAAWALVLLAGGAGAQDLAQACQRSRLASVVPAEQVEKSAEELYAQLLDGARRQNSLAPRHHPQEVRLRYMLERMVPFTEGCNDRSKDWHWQIHLVGNQKFQFWSLPGGKLIMPFGILRELQLDDDELAALVAHAMAESLLELARARIASQLMTKQVIELGVAMLGAGASSPLPGMGATLTELRQSRLRQLQAGRLAMILSARAGYPPQAAVSLWQKLRPRQASPQPMLDPYPPLPALLAELERQLPALVPVYEQAPRPDRRFSPPPLPVAPAPAVAPVTSATE